MAKIKAPLFSLDATGTLDKNITYKENKQNKIALKYSKPGSANPFESSPRQKDQRSIIRLITIHWQCMTDLDKLSWETAAKDARFKGTGYHYFLHMAQQNLTQYLGLVGYWSMNYNIDDKIPDLSGNGNHGTLSPIYPCDSPTLVDSFDRKHGKALLVNGTSNYLNVPYSPTLSPLELSFGALIYLPSTPQPIPSSTGIISTSGPSYDIGYNLYYKVSTNRWYYRIGSTVMNTIETLANKGSWQYIFCTYSNSNGGRMRLYLNGTLKASDFGTISYSSYNLTIGFWYINNYFFGRVDDFPIFNKELSQEEISKLSSLI